MLLEITASTMGNSSRPSIHHTLYFSVKWRPSILAQCTECVAGKEPRSSLWKTIDKECNVGFSTKFSCGKYIPNDCSFSSLGGYLVAMSYARFPNLIWAHSPYTKSWICVGKICTSLWYNTVLVSRGSELVLFCEVLTKCSR